MYIKIGPYPNRMISKVYENYMNDKYGYVDWPDYTPSKGLGPGKNQPFKEAFLEKLEDILQTIYNCTINLVLDRRVQKVKVHIDRWDTWSMDYTLAPIILPMLQQLKKEKHGAPIVDDSDVPKELHMTKKQQAAFDKDGSAPDKFFKRWDWIMDEMIWAFEQKNRDHWEEDYYGPYIKGEDGGILGGRFEWTDDEGRKKHQERMSNGFRLFGKYYENLWD